MCFLFAVPHCGKQIQARGLRYSGNIPRHAFFMTQHLSPAWRVTGHGVHLWCFRLCLQRHSKTQKCLLPIKKSKYLCVVFRKIAKMCYMHKHLCDPHTALIWLLISSIAPSHFVELGGSRAVLCLPEMERKRVSIQGACFFKYFFSAVNSELNILFFHLMEEYILFEWGKNEFCKLFWYACSLDLLNIVGAVKANSKHIQHSKIQLDQSLACTVPLYCSSVTTLL